MLASNLRLRRTGVVLLVVALLGAVTAVGMADTSPGGHDAGPWPSAWTPVTRTDGSVVADLTGDASPGYTDLVGGPVGDEATLMAAFDGANLFLRLRLAEDPVVSDTDYASAVWLVALGVNGEYQGAVGFDGKPPGSQTEYVYVVDADGTTVTRVYEDPFEDGPNNNSQGVRGTEQDAAGNWFLDFQVPVEVLYEGTGVEPGDRIQLFAGTSTANDASSINKDWMLGDAVEFTGLVGRRLVSSELDLTRAHAVIDGTDPPSVGATTRYQVRFSARNSGFNAITDLSITDQFTPGVTIESVSESSGGAISIDGSAVTWEPADLLPGTNAVATVVISVTPALADLGALLALDIGALGAGVDSATGVVSEVQVDPIEVGPVTGVAGVALLKSFVAGTPAVAGDGVNRQFALTAVNEGESLLTEVAIFDEVDAGLVVASTNCADLGGVDLTAANFVLCEGLVLPAQSALELVVTFSVAATTDTSTIENEAALSALELGDPITSQLATLEVVEEVALSIEKAFAAPTLPAGSVGSSFSVTVTNGGPSDADNVVVSDAVDSRLTVTGVSSDVGNCVGGGAPATVSCEIGTLSPGQTAEVVVEFDLGATAAPGDVIENVAEVASDETAASIPSNASSLTVSDRVPLPPTANDDVATTEAGTAVTVVVLANDSDPEGDALSVASVTVFGKGSVVINGSGTVTYLPASGFVGQDSFTYLACESDRPEPLCDTATVVVTVTEVDRPPALDTNGSTIDRIVVGEVPADLPIHDPEGKPILVKVAAGSPPPGVVVRSDGTFAGAAGQVGAFILTLDVCDPAGNCAAFVYAIVVEAAP